MPCWNLSTKTLFALAYIYNLSVEQVKYAIMCAKLFANNSNINIKYSIHETQPCTSNKFVDKKILQSMPLLPRSIVNLCDNLQHFRKLSRDDPDYKNS